MKAKIVFLGIAVVVLAASGPSTLRAAQIGSDGTCSGAVATSVVDMFAQYPNGGPGLVTAIASMLGTNPSLLADVICESRRGNKAQQVAAAAGYAQAEGGGRYFFGGGYAFAFYPPVFGGGFGGGVPSPNRPAT